MYYTVKFKKLGFSAPLKSWYSQLPCLTFSIKEIVWRTIQQVRLLCPWASHLTECVVRLVVSDGSGGGATPLQSAGLVIGKVAKPWFDSRCGSASRVLEKDA